MGVPHCWQRTKTFLGWQNVIDNWPSVPERLKINFVMQDILDCSDSRNSAKERYIDTDVWTSFVRNFRRQLVKEPLKAFHEEENFHSFYHILDSSPRFDAIDLHKLNSKEVQDWKNKIKEFLVPIILDKAEKNLLGDIKSFQTLCNTSDLRIPHEWYPAARLMKRKIIYHGGPTNSGKVRSYLSLPNT